MKAVKRPKGSSAGSSSSPILGFGLVQQSQQGGEDNFYVCVWLGLHGKAGVQ